MKLEELLGEELYAQVKAKMDEVNGKEPDKLKHVRYADLSEGEYVSKGKYDSLSSELTGKQSELDKANELISSLKKSEAKNEALKAKFADYEAQISQLQAQNKADKLNSAVKVALLASGASDVDYITFKLNERLNKDGITLDLDDNGNVKGLDDRISELKTAFEIGFIIFVPFIVLDLVVANILLALGMFMLSPTIISLPFKLLIFIAVDGWALIVQGLVTSYN